jgi:hypothetical protein
MKNVWIVATLLGEAMKIPSTLTHDEVVKTLVALDAGFTHRWGKSKKYDLIHDGKRYSPKAVLGVTLARILRKNEFYFGFSGGEETNSVLRNLGFEVVERTSISKPSR